MYFVFTELQQKSARTRYRHEGMSQASLLRVSNVFSNFQKEIIKISRRNLRSLFPRLNVYTFKQRNSRSPFHSCFIKPLKCHYPVLFVWSLTRFPEKLYTIFLQLSVCIFLFSYFSLYPPSIPSLTLILSLLWLILNVLIFTVLMIEVSE